MRWLYGCADGGVLPPLSNTVLREAICFSDFPGEFEKGGMRCRQAQWGGGAFDPESIIYMGSNRPMPELPGPRAT